MHQLHRVQDPKEIEGDNQTAAGASSSTSTAWTKMSSGAMLTGGCCVLLTLQNSSYTLLRRYSSGVLHEQASSQSILAVGEILKGVFCGVMVSRGLQNRNDKQVDLFGAAASCIFDAYDGVR